MSRMCIYTCLALHLFPSTCHRFLVSVSPTQLGECGCCWVDCRSRTALCSAHPGGHGVHLPGLHCNILGRGRALPVTKLTRIVPGNAFSMFTVLFTDASTTSYLIRSRRAAKLYIVYELLDRRILSAYRTILLFAAQLHSSKHGRVAAAEN